MGGGGKKREIRGGGGGLNGSGRNSGDANEQKYGAGLKESRGVLRCSKCKEGKFSGGNESAMGGGGLIPRENHRRSEGGEGPPKDKSGE